MELTNEKKKRMERKHNKKLSRAAAKFIDDGAEKTFLPVILTKQPAKWQLILPQKDKRWHKKGNGKMVIKFRR